MDTFDAKKDSSFKIGVNSIVLCLISMLFAVDVLGGPLRLYLSSIGFESIIYIPKVLCLSFIVYTISRTRINKALFYCLFLIALYSIIAVIHKIEIFQILFTLIIILPLLFGIVSAPYLYGKQNIFVFMIAAMFIVTVSGVCINIFIDFPWQGLSYNMQGLEVEGTREWTTFGLKRVAGFTRLSAGAAFYIVTCALFLISYSSSWSYRIIIILFGFPAVLATTNKAAIVGFVIGIGSLLLDRCPRMRSLLVYALAATVMLLPLSTLARNYDIDLRDPVGIFLLTSFEDRLIHTWPDFMGAVSTFANPVTGVGFGAIGTASKYGFNASHEVFTFADNFALYLYGCFGILVVVLFYYLAHVTCLMFRSKVMFQLSLAPVMVAIFAISITTDIIESQVLAFMMGIIVSSEVNTV